MMALAGAGLLLAGAVAARAPGASFRPHSGEELPPRGATRSLGVLELSDVAEQDCIVKPRRGGLWRTVYLRASPETALASGGLLSGSGADRDLRAVTEHDQSRLDGQSRQEAGAGLRLLVPGRSIPGAGIWDPPHPSRVPGSRRLRRGTSPIAGWGAAPG